MIARQTAGPHRRRPRQPLQRGGDLRRPRAPRADRAGRLRRRARARRGRHAVAPHAQRARAPRRRLPRGRPRAVRRAAARRQPRPQDLDRPARPALGYTLNLPEEDRYLKTRRSCSTTCRCCSAVARPRRSCSARSPPAPPTTSSAWRRSRASMVHEYAMGTSITSRKVSAEGGAVSDRTRQLRDEEQQHLSDEAMRGAARADHRAPRQARRARQRAAAQRGARARATSTGSWRACRASTGRPGHGPAGRRQPRRTDIAGHQTRRLAPWTDVRAPQVRLGGRCPRRWGRRLSPARGRVTAPPTSAGCSRPGRSARSSSRSSGSATSQPIGYEGLARFPTPPGLVALPPDVTLAAAGPLGLRDELEVACWAAMSEAGDAAAGPPAVRQRRPRRARPPRPARARRAPARAARDRAHRAGRRAEHRPAPASGCGRGSPAARWSPSTTPAPASPRSSTSPSCAPTSSSSAAAWSPASTSTPQPPGRPARHRRVRPRGRRARGRRGRGAPEELAILRDAEVDYGQGWLFGRPAAAWPRSPSPRAPPPPVARRRGGSSASRRRRQRARRLRGRRRAPRPHGPDAERVPRAGRPPALPGRARLLADLRRDARDRRRDRADVPHRRGARRSSTTSPPATTTCSPSPSVHRRGLRAAARRGRVVGVLNAESPTPPGDDGVAGRSSAAPSLLAAATRGSSAGPRRGLAGPAAGARRRPAGSLEDRRGHRARDGPAARALAGFESAMLALADGYGGLYVHHAEGPFAVALRDARRGRPGPDRRLGRHAAPRATPSTTAAGAGSRATSCCASAGAASLDRAAAGRGGRAASACSCSPTAPRTGSPPSTSSCSSCSPSRPPAALRMAAAVLELRERAARDPLTGLGHHATFYDDAARPARDRRRAPPLRVLIADLDGFKAINDTRGHAAGDDALRAMAALLRAASPAGGRAFRIGGDEFALRLRVRRRGRRRAVGWELRTQAPRPARLDAVGRPGARRRRRERRGRRRARRRGALRGQAPRPRRRQWSLTDDEPERPRARPSRARARRRRISPSTLSSAALRQVDLHHVTRARAARRAAARSCRGAGPRRAGRAPTREPAGRITTSSTPSSGSASADPRAAAERAADGDDHLPARRPSNTVLAVGADGDGQRLLGGGRAQRADAVGERAEARLERLRVAGGDRGEAGAGDVDERPAVGQPAELERAGARRRSAASSAASRRSPGSP